MKKNLSKFVLSVFVIWQIFSLAAYAETPEGKLGDLATVKIEASVESEVKTNIVSKFEEKVAEVKNEVDEVKEVPENKELLINNKFKELKEVKEDKDLKIEEIKPVEIEKPIVSSNQAAVAKITCSEKSLPENTEWVIKSWFDYVPNTQKNVWSYVDFDDFDVKNWHCEWTCNKGKWYIYNKSTNSCVKLQAIDLENVPCADEPKDTKWMVKTKISTYNALNHKNIAWEYVDYKLFNQVKNVCKWTCEEWYTLNKEKNWCVETAVYKIKCDNEPAESKWMLKSKINYIPSNIGLKEKSWEYISYKEFDSAKTACAWTCDEKKWFELSKDKKSCVYVWKTHDVTWDQSCKEVWITPCLWSVTQVIDWYTYELPKPESLEVTYTLTYKDHSWTTTETRTAKFKWYYKNDEYFQKCGWEAKCGEAKIYQPWDKVAITEDVTFHALWEVEDLNVTVKSTSSYREWSYRYDFVNWNKADSDDSLKAWETFKLLQDTTLVANYNPVYVWWGNWWWSHWWNWGGNWGNSSNEEIVLPWQVEWCTVVNSTYPEEWNEAFLYACENGITSINDVNEARLDDKMTRAEMAKFIAQFALISLKRTPANLNKDCSNFADSIASYSTEMKNYMTLACKYEYMWVTPTYWVMSDFMPAKNLSRAEFGTVLSRILWWNTYESTNSLYYTKHLNALKKSGIITDTNPDLVESRGYVMLMLYRAAKDQWLIK